MLVRLTTQVIMLNNDTPCDGPLLSGVFVVVVHKINIQVSAYHTTVTPRRNFVLVFPEQWAGLFFSGLRYIRRCQICVLLWEGDLLIS